MKFRPYTASRTQSKPRRPFINLVNRHPKRRPYTPLTWQPFRILLVGI